MASKSLAEWATLRLGNLRPRAAWADALCGVCRICFIQVPWASARAGLPGWGLKSCFGLGVRLDYVGSWVNGLAFVLRHATQSQQNVERCLVRHESPASDS